MIRLVLFFVCSSQVPDKISVTTQLCNFSTKGAIDSMQMSRCGAGPVNPHTQSVAGLGSQACFLIIPLHQTVSFEAQCYFSLFSSSHIFLQPEETLSTSLKMLMAINSLCLCLDGIVLFLHQFGRDFSGNRILGQPFLTPIILKMLFHCLLAH